MEIYNEQDNMKITETLMEDGNRQNTEIYSRLKRKMKINEDTPSTCIVFDFYIQNQLKMFLNLFDNFLLSKS